MDRQDGVSQERPGNMIGRHKRNGHPHGRPADGEARSGAVVLGGRRIFGNVVLGALALELRRGVLALGDLLEVRAAVGVVGEVDGGRVHVVDRWRHVVSHTRISAGAGKEPTVDGAEERGPEEESPRVVRLGAHGARAVRQLPRELTQGHVDGVVPKGEVERAIVVAGDDHLLEERVLVGAEVVGEGVDEVLGQVTEGRASVKEDGELLVRVRLGFPLAVGDGDLVQVDPVSRTCSLAMRPSLFSCFILDENQMSRVW